MKNPIKEKDKKKKDVVVFRGGSRSHRAGGVWVSFRFDFDPRLWQPLQYDHLGFRIVRTKKE